MDVKMVNKKTHALTFNSIPLITDCLRKGKRKKICVVVEPSYDESSVMCTL